jgi:hypothetical protein
VRRLISKERVIIAKRKAQKRIMRLWSKEEITKVGYDIIAKHDSRYSGGKYVVEDIIHLFHKYKRTSTICSCDICRYGSYNNKGLRRKRELEFKILTEQYSTYGVC